MYIADVIGSLREKYLEVARRVDEIRTLIHLIESQLNAMNFRIQVLEDMHPRREATVDVSRETKEGDGNASSS